MLTKDYKIPVVSPPPREDKEEEEDSAKREHDDDDDDDVRVPKKRRADGVAVPDVVPKGTFGTIVDVYTIGGKDTTVVSKGEGETKWSPIELKVIKPSPKTIVTVVFDNIDYVVWITNLYKPKKANMLIEEVVGRRWPFVPAFWLTIRDVAGREFDRVHVVLRGVESRREVCTALSRTKR